MIYTSEQKQNLIAVMNDRIGSEQYKLAANGRIYTYFMGKKTFLSMDSFVSRFKSSNSLRNAFAVKRWIEQNGGEEVGSSSRVGSWYYMFKGVKVRVSDHCWTSQFHKSPDVNLCSYDLNGHESMIAQLANLNA
jgi:hypothetical protein